jgi:hypothetical protein
MMRFFALVFVTALLLAPEALASSLSSALQSPQRLSVTPRTGETTTTFRVPFTARLASTGPSTLSGQQRVRYTVSAAREAGASERGCADSYSATVFVAKAHERVTARLNQVAVGRKWCVGGYSGKVSEIITPACGPIVAQPERRRAAGACPQYIVAEPIGTFHFTVRR